MSLSLELTLIAEFLLLLGFLYAGSRFGGIGLGVVSGIGLMFEVLVLRMPPGKAPVDVMLVILAVVTCASVLEAAGGLKYMLQAPNASCARIRSASPSWGRLSPTP